MARVLIIEDEELTLQSYIDCLRGMKAVSDVVPAKSATEALKAIDNGSYDLVLLDIMMCYLPDELTSLPVERSVTASGRRMGYWLYDVIRQKHPKVPVIVISVLGPETVKHELYGATKILRKGDSIDDVISAIQAVLGGSANE